MKIPKNLQFTSPDDATAVAIGILQIIPHSWLEQLYQAASRISLTLELDLKHDRLNADGLLMLDLTRHLQQISAGNTTTYLVNALAPLFMVKDGSKTDYIRRSHAEGIIKFSGLKFSFGK